MLFGLNLTTTTVFAQDTEASVKIQLLSEALHARDAGDLLLAKEKVERLIAIAPNDKNVQALLITINETIEDEGIEIPNNQRSEVSITGETPINKDNGNSSNSAPVLSSNVESAEIPINEVSSVYLDQKLTVEELLLAAKNQIAAGDLSGATSTLIEIEARDPNSREAKLLSLKLTQAIDLVQSLNVYQTRESMLNAVDNSWEQPKLFELEDTSKTVVSTEPSLLRKLQNIVLPKINFTGMALTRVIEVLSELSVEYDSEGQGVNIVALFDSSKFNPDVNITLRNLF